MFGPFERQSVHIPEPPRVVMAAAAGAQSSPDRPAAARFVPEDMMTFPHRLTSGGVCSEQMSCEKGSKL